MPVLIDEFNTRFVDYLKQEFPTNDRNLLVIGKPGIGKTFLVKHLVTHDYFLDEPTFRQMIASKHRLLRPPEAWGENIKIYALDALSKLPLVIYDDYGAGTSTSAYLEKMQYWLDKRIERGLKTVITTNLPSKEKLIARDPRLASRLLMNADIYVCQGRPDKREQSSCRILS